MPAVGAVLVGGKSSRMGENKAFIKIHEVSLIERVVKEMSRVLERVMVVGGPRDLYSHLGVQVVEDVFQDCGPLGGIHAALLNSKDPYVFVAACDMPFFRSEVITYLLSQAADYDVVVPRIGDYLEPLCAVYGRRCLKPIEDSLKRGIFKVTHFYTGVRVNYVDGRVLADAVGEPNVFVNVNTPGDVSALKKE